MLRSSTHLTSAMAAAVAALMAATAPAAAQTAPAATVIADDAFFPEGPYVLDGVLHWAEYASGQVRTWDGSEVATLWEREGCGPSAVAPLGDDLAVTCYDNGTVARISRSGEDVATYDADADGDPLVGPNDFAPDGAGGLWMTASGPWDSAPIVGAVYHISADGAVTPAADDLHYANGIALHDGRLYVNESEARRVISFAVDGLTLSDRRLAVRVADVDPDSGAGAYPDGLKIDADGRLWIGQFSTGRIVVTTPDGALDRVIAVDAATAPNLAFSADGGSIFVMAVDQTDAAPYAGRVLEIALD